MLPTLDSAMLVDQVRSAYPVTAVVFRAFGLGPHHGQMSLADAAACCALSESAFVGALYAVLPTVD